MIYADHQQYIESHLYLNHSIVIFLFKKGRLNINFMLGTIFCQLHISNSVCIMIASKEGSIEMGKEFSMLYMLIDQIRHTFLENMCRLMAVYHQKDIQWRSLSFNTLLFTGFFGRLGICSRNPKFYL